MPGRARLKRSVLWLLLAAAMVFASARESPAQTVARCGQGWLELIDGYPVLHLKGTHYEMGYQQGALFKDHIRQNMKALLIDRAQQTVKLGLVSVKPRSVIDSITTIQKPFVPKKYYEEMQGLAAGADLKTADVIAGNFIPELFHCSGFAIMNSAT